MPIRSPWDCNRRPRRSSGCHACSPGAVVARAAVRTTRVPRHLVPRNPTLERRHRTGRARPGRSGAMGARPVHPGLYRRLGDARARISADVCGRRRLRSVARDDPRLRRRGARVIGRVRDRLAARSLQAPAVDGSRSTRGCGAQRGRRRRAPGSCSCCDCRRSFRLCC